MDTMGNLLAVVVHATNIHDTKSGILAARDAFEKYPSIQRFCADAGYRKNFEQDVSRELGLGVDISVRIKPEWDILPKRWIVKRSLAWLNHSYRLSKDYEISVRSAQAICLIAAVRTLLKRFYPIGTASKFLEGFTFFGRDFFVVVRLVYLFPPQILERAPSTKWRADIPFGRIFVID